MSVKEMLHPAIRREWGCSGVSAGARRPLPWARRDNWQRAEAPPRAGLPLPLGWVRRLGWVGDSASPPPPSALQGCQGREGVERVELAALCRVRWSGKFFSTGRRHLAEGGGGYLPEHRRETESASGRSLGFSWDRQTVPGISLLPPCIAHFSDVQSRCALMPRMRCMPEGATCLNVLNPSLQEGVRE